MSKRRKWEGRIYLGRDSEGKQLFHWVGRFTTRRERDEAVAEERVRLKRGGPAQLPTCDEYVDRYLAEYERKNKSSSHDTQRERLKRFRKDFAGRSLDIRRAEAKDWTNAEGSWSSQKPPRPDTLQAVVTLYNHAIDEDDLPLERNPFRKLGSRTKGRAEEPPPSAEEFQALLNACSTLKDYGKTIRALTLFSAFTLMRPSELYVLEWGDIDFQAMRIRKARRLYRGEVDEPKYGAVTIALTPPARDAIIGLPRDDGLVFHSKTGKRLSQTLMSGYWSRVLAKADLDFDFYHATKHYGVHYLWTELGLSRRAIAAQAGWSLSTVDKMLAIYGHGEVGALEEVDAAFKNVQAPRLRKIEGGKQS